MGSRLKLAVAGAIGLLITASAAVGLSAPTQLIGAAIWSVVVTAVLYGLGGLARRGFGIELRLGEQLVLGTCAWLAMSGSLLALGTASRLPLLVLAAVGVASTMAELWRWGRSAPRPRDPAEDRALWIGFLVALSGFLALNLLGSIGTRGNPADDQVAYTALVKRVLDCGNLIEPFSFRRLSAYGGQTMLLALSSLRGDVAAIDLLDRGIFQWIAVLVMLDLAYRRRLSSGITVLLVIVLLSLWPLELNSGALWTGFTMFLSAYGFATREDLPVRPRLMLTFAVLGAACTLRQNYLLPAGVFGILLLLEQLRTTARGSSWRTAWIAERRTLLLAVAAVAIVVVPYMIATFRSSHTALYPILPGTGDPDTPLRPTGGTILEEIGFFITIVCTPEPIRVWWLLLPAMLIAKDPRPLRPWRAYLIACGLGFVALVHTFMLSDAWNLWRYAFAYMTPLALVFAMESATRLPFVSQSESSERDPRGLVVPVAATFLVWLSLVLNMIQTRYVAPQRFNTTLQNIKAGWVFGTSKYDPRIRSYAELQRSIPAGETVAILLDDPWVLDYARNTIINLDVPGFAAPAPGLPSFTTPEHWRAYLRGQGIRYVAFTEPGESTYLYRRAHWVERMFRDDELYQFMAAHMIDTFDALAGLARSSTTVFDRDGMKVIDLGVEVPPEADRGPPERRRRDQFVRRISEQELGHGAWQLASRSNVVFMHDGLGPGPIALPPVHPDHVWDLLFPSPPHRWLMDRTRIRVLGSGRATAHGKLIVDKSRAYTSPIVTISLDGRTLAELRPDKEGIVTFDVGTTCSGWCDLYITFNATFDWWQGPEANGVARLLELDWVPAS
jgi:hypothetical protein